MPTRFQCPGCNVKLVISSKKTGDVIECPKCKARVRVPEEPPVLEGISLPPQSPVAPEPEPQQFNSEPPASSDSESYSFDDDDDEYPRRQSRSKVVPGCLMAFFSAIIVIGIGLIIYAATKDNNPKLAAKKEAPPSKNKLPQPAQQPIERNEQPIQQITPEAGAGIFAGISLFVCLISFGIGLLILHILIMIWIVRDARNRSLEGEVMWLVASLIFGFIVWIIYLASRPPGSLVNCDRCSNKRLYYVKICPHCGWETNSMGSD